MAREMSLFCLRDAVQIDFWFIFSIMVQTFWKSPIFSPKLCPLCVFITTEVLEVSESARLYFLSHFLFDLLLDLRLKTSMKKRVKTT